MQQRAFDEKPLELKALEVDILHDVANKVHDKLISQHIFLSQRNRRLANQKNKAKKLRKMQKISRKRNR